MDDIPMQNAGPGPTAGTSAAPLFGRAEAWAANAEAGPNFESEPTKLNPVRQAVERRPWTAVGLAAVGAGTAAVLALRKTDGHRRQNDHGRAIEPEAAEPEPLSCPYPAAYAEYQDVAAVHREEHSRAPVEPVDTQEAQVEATKQHLEENEPSFLSELAMSAFSAVLGSLAAGKKNGKQPGLLKAVYRGRSMSAKSPAHPSVRLSSRPAEPLPTGAAGGEKTFPRPKHDRSRTAPKSWWSLIKTTFVDFFDNKAPRLAAALAYYTVFSIAPLLLITIAVAGTFAGDEASTQSELRDSMVPVLGATATDAILGMVEGASRAGGGLVATLIGLGALIFGASAVFAQMKDALDTIWEVEPKPGRGILGTVIDRARSFLLVFLIGILLLSSMFASTAINFMSEHVSHILPVPNMALHLINVGISATVLTLLFGIIFKYLPDVEIQWKDVLVGAFVTALLFLIGNYAIGLYISKAAIGSAYGPAGTILIVLLWANYSAMIFLLGAEFTQAYALMYGSQIQPSADAMAVEKRQ